ncbi:MAG: glycosyltransferase family 8 protein [Planctomycetaceae bacterium]|nr:glycosyltransferase family 8 protein [Planctomycetaceae bacterium]
MSDRAIDTLKAHAPTDRCACATVITTPKYVIGAMVLGHSLRMQNWPHELVVFVTADVGTDERQELLRVWDRVVEIEPIANPNQRKELAFSSFATTYTKLRVWEQTEYAKLILLDADTTVMGDLTDLLDRPDFAAGPCGTACDQFNSGVMVLTPSQAVFEDMLTQLSELGSYDGGDQGFLNSYFSDWYTGPGERRLPFSYNVPWLLAFYAKAWKRIEDEIKVIHYYGPQKPWQLKGETAYTILTRVVRFMTSLEVVEPSPRATWWNIHADMQKTLRAQAKAGLKRAG